MKVDRRARPRTPAPRPYWRLVVSALCISAPIVMALCLVLPFLMPDTDAVPHELILPVILLGAGLVGGLFALTVLRTE